MVQDSEDIRPSSMYPSNPVAFSLFRRHYCRAQKPLFVRDQGGNT
jgi:hypothetical protein